MENQKSTFRYERAERKPFSGAANVIHSNVITQLKDLRRTSNLEQTRTFLPAETSPTQHECYYLNPLNADGVPVIPSRRANMSILALAVGRFYPASVLDMVTNEELLTGLASIILSCTNFSVNPAWDELKTAMRTSLIDLSFKPLTPDEVNQLFTTVPGVKEMMKVFSPKELVHLVEHSEAFLVIGCIILLTIGKNIDPRYYDRWVANRVRGFCGALGQQHIMGKLTIDCLPRADVMNRLSNVISSSTAVRRELFIGISTIARSYNRNNYGVAFDEIMQLLRGTEMAHIAMIEDYIYSRVPVFANTRLLPTLNTHYKNAVEYLRKIPVSERLYVETLREKNETAPLSRTLFSNAIIVASTIAAFDGDSYNNYTVEEGPNVSKLRAITLGYISHIQRSTGVNAIEESGMPKISGQLLLEDLIAEYERKGSCGEPGAGTTIISQDAIKVQQY